MRGRPGTALAVILAVALVVRVAVVLLTPDYEPLFDAADYDSRAASVVSGDGFGPSALGPGPSAFRPPLYPLALAGVQALGGGWTAERFLGVLFGVVSVFLIFLIAIRLWDRRTALVAAAIAAVFPPLVLLNVSTLSETLFVPLSLAALLAVLHYRDDERLRWAVLGGLLCGLAILTRTSGVPLVLALAFGVWIARPRFSRPALAAPLTLVLATVLTVAPWVVRNTVVFDRWVGLSTATGFALVGTYNPESRAEASRPGEPFSPNTLDSYESFFKNRARDDEAEVTAQLNDDATDYMRDHPGYVLETMAWNVLRVFDIRGDIPFRERFAAKQVQALGVERVDSPVLFLGPLFAVLALALVGVAAQAGLLPSRRAPLFVWSIPVLLLLPALVIYGLPRYRAPIDPYLVMLAAVGTAALGRRIARTSAFSGTEEAPPTSQSSHSPAAKVDA